MRTSDLRVLLVEDDLDVADVVAIVVGGLGWSCRVAHTCATARAEISTYDPDLVILDEHLADGTGLELARWMRTLGRPVFVISFSGTSASADEFDAYLPKPATVSTLRETLTRAVAVLEQRRT